ncbi:MAG: hypothetical protein PUG10_09570 [Lachnospiraceae bacterium]|nr:hypothetical protein [Lachnospiraceae bacterium]
MQSDSVTFHLCERFSLCNRNVEALEEIEIVVLICVLPIIAVCVNDSIAKNVMKDVKDKNLPENTTYVESFSAAGKL